MTYVHGQAEAETCCTVDQLPWLNTLIANSFTSMWLRNNIQQNERELNNANDLHSYTCHHNDCLKRMTSFFCPKIWNQPEELKFTANITSFKLNLNQYMYVIRE
jgi:hypothetical protein